MLHHPRIKVLLNTCYREIAALLPKARVFYTGRIDDFFDCRLGELPYRSLKLDFQILETPSFQAVGTHNYPDNGDFTRITEMKTLSGQDYLPRTTICVEHPVDFVAGANEPFYPVPRPVNRDLYHGYRQLAESAGSSVIFAGRLGDYQYYNMDQAIARALSLAEEMVDSA
jgi:UDP-galactopyranose mutase